MKLPLILLNFKAYEESIGKKALKLAKICEEVAKKKRVNIIIAPCLLDLELVVKKVKIPVFAQHFDVEAGAFTGSIPILLLKKIGVKGSLINHSEKKLKFDEIKKRVELTRKHKLINIVCASNLREIKQIVTLRPDFIAYEPPELIGSGIPVSQAKPKIVKKAVELVEKISSKTKVLCGAGISSGVDVKKAIELGTKGVLIASAFVKAKSPKKKLLELISFI
jgi:triosephosphate isomerase